ncbi:bifunctional metallophosphatase/5'-nucleotidase [Lactococcus nasutitermitis]|uniref:Bifunctional metallophosphatase/5'-nucleotidase n=1 Tax=Lactococcus nasutitermitis TaxID=1652957 RepID=A0ABV9JFE0_9LACT|nr:bifunctional UDP-sugar hydrolase/5'-nucleotidase [Lactococcus nasutitermitis]
MNNLRILHLNDLHSHLKKFPIIERFFAEESLGQSDVFRFDLGDNVDRMHPISEATDGQMNVELMNRLKLTAATIGNNEGLGLTHEMLEHLYDKANFPVLLSNLNPPFAQGPQIFTTSWGLRVGVLGLTAPYKTAYPYTGWELRDPFEVLDELLPLDCDFTILLSHLGKSTDEKIAQNYDIDLIIGSHTHHLFEHGAQLNGTLLAAAGKYGEHIGEIDLTFDGKNLIESQIEAISTNTLPKKKSDLLESHGWEVQGHTLLRGTQVAQLEKALSNQFPDFEASHFIAGKFADFGNVAACVMNSGLLVTDELPAEITLDTLHDVLPHSMRLIRFTFTGAELKNVLTEIIDVSAFLGTQQIQGMGFRGKSFGNLVMQGISLEDGEFYFGDKVVENEATYQVVMPDQYLFAWYFPLLKKTGKSEILFPDLLREIIAKELTKEA